MRLALPAFLLLTLLYAAPVFAVTPEDAKAAIASVTSLDDTLLATMKEGKALGYQGRYDRMAPVVDNNFDLEFMTRFLVAAKWDTLTPDQQASLTAAFRSYTIGEYANRFTDYDGETFRIVGAPTDQRSDIRVQTELQPKTSAPVKLDYILHHTNDGLQIIDVFLQGTISELATERSQFQSVLAANGVDGLIAMLDKKAGDASITGAASNGNPNPEQARKQ